MNKKLSVISPVYKAEGVVHELVERILQAVQTIGLDVEIILVEDHGGDGSWAKIEEASAKDHRVKGFKLSRNFGQHYAITAGLDQATGDLVVVMDCDLQDRPEEIPNLYHKLMEGYDIVLARRADRKDGNLKRLSSKAFYGALGYLSGSEQDEAVANFGIYTIQVIQEVRNLRESIRYFPTMVKWVGFRTAKLDVRHDARVHGKTSYDLNKLFRLAMDIILAYSDKPLRLIVKAGMVISVLALGMAVYMLIRWALGTITVMGYASLMVSIWFLSGVLLSTLGVVGLYVGKTFEGVKRRPLYIIERSS